MKKKEKLNYTVSILFLVYLALLIWIILFKLQFSILDLDQVREINLIPFYYEHEVTFHATEVLENVMIFMPFGIYLCLLFPKSRFSVKLLLISMVSLLLEICQYVLAIGRADITDMITNICGGLFGIILYLSLIHIWRGNYKRDSSGACLSGNVSVGRERLEPVVYDGIFDTAWKS